MTPKSPENNAICLKKSQSVAISLCAICYCTKHLQKLKKEKMYQFYKFAK